MTITNRTKNIDWRVYIARVKYHELVTLYKKNKNYAKHTAQRYYNISKPFGKIAYRDKKEYLIAINELKSILKTDPNFGDIHFGLALSYGLLGQHKNEVLSFKKAINLKPELIDLLTMKQRKIVMGHEITSN